MTGAASSPGASSRSSTVARSSTWRRRSTSSRTGPTHSDPMPDVPASRVDHPVSPRPEWRRSRRARPQRGGVAQGAADRDAVRRHADVGAHRARARPTRTCGCAPSARCPTTRCCTRRSWRTRPTSCCSAPPTLPHASGWGHEQVHVREPRPRDVVPPAVPRRRMAAVPLPQPGRGRVARGLSMGHLPSRRRQQCVTIAQEGLMRPGAADRPGVGAERVTMPSPSGAVDLRSDTVTTPTPAMRRAMADADVGDDAYGEDPTVRRLESLAAGLLGKEAALYVPSGRWRTSSRCGSSARAGTEVLCGERAHVYRYEHAAAAGNAGVQLRPLPGCRRPPRRSTTSTAALASQAASPARDLRARDREHAHACERPAVAPGASSSR